MSTQKSQYPPSHRWASDGNIVEGTVTGLRFAKGREEYGGGYIPVLELQKPGTGDVVGLWLSGRLKTEVESCALRFGDFVRIERGEMTPFTTKTGEQRTFYPYTIDVKRPNGTDLPMDGPQLPGQPPVEDDESIPF